MTQKSFTFILLMLTLVGLQNSARATHLMGGDFTYRYLYTQSNKVYYETKLVIYRDCNFSAGFANPVSMGVYNANSNGVLNIRQVYMVGGKANNVTPTCIPATGICIEEAVYIDTVNYATNQTYGVYITCGGTARNAAITNLDLGAGKNAGMAWQIYIPPPKQYINSSPAFVNKPLPFLCTNKQMVFSNNAYDADGDSVVFSFVLPYGSKNPGGGYPNSGYPVPPPLSATTCTWASGYSTTQPLGSSGSISMDSFTGEITATAPSSNNFVIAIEIKEYRTLSDGSVILMSEVRRDLQVVAKACANYYPPKLVSYGGGTSKTVKVGDSICFNITGTDSLGDSVFISASGVMFDSISGGTAPFATFAKKGGDSIVTQQFCWKPGCNHARSQPYIMTVDLINTNCGSDQKTFTVTVNAMPTGNTPQLRCADVVSSTQVKLTWINPSTQSSLTTKYYIFRKPAGGSYTLIDSTSLTATSYTDNSVTGATTTQYVYEIVPVNTCYNYPSGNSISTILITGTLSGQSVVNLLWNNPSTAYQPYKFFLYKDNGTGWTYADSTVNDSISQYARGCTSSHRYKVVGYDSVGSCTSSSTFTSYYTLKDKLPPIVQGYVKATITPSVQVQLEWKPNDSGDVAWYYIYRKTTGAFIFLDSVKNNKSNYFKYIDNSANINSGNLPYYYKIQAVDSCGNIGSMYEHHAPVNLQGQAENFRVKLWWYNYQGFKGFSKVVLVRADTASNYVWAPFKTLTINDSIVYDSATSCYSPYWYKVQFYDINDTNLYTESDTIILTAYDTIRPIAPNVEMATVISGTQINLLFNPSTSKDVDRYFIYKSTNGGTFVLDTVLTYPPGNPIVYTDTKVNALDNRYCYYVMSHDSCQNLISKDSTIHCAMQLHGQPGNNRVYLQFYPYKGYTVSDYNIQRWSNGTWVNIYNTATAGDTSYIDSVGVRCKLNYYRIQSLYLGSYPTSYSDSIAIQPFDTQPPPKPVFDYVTTTNHSRIDLNWSQTDPDVNRIVLYRALNGGTPVPYDTLAGNIIHFSDSSVDAAKYYYTYTLEAFDSCSNNSSGKALLHNSINLEAQLDICKRLYNMKWNTYKNWAGGVSQYQLYRSSNGGAYSVYKTFSATDSTYTDAAISVNTFYRYVIVASENGGGANTSRSDTVNFDFKNVRGPVIHSVSKVETSTTNGAVLIAWKALELDSFVKYSRLYYSSTGAAGSYSLIKDNIPFTVDTFTHTGLNTRTKNHWYYMVSVDSCNILTDSNGIHKTMDLSVTLKKLRNKLNWTPYKGWKVGSYIIMRKDTGGFYPVGTVAGTDTFHTDFPSPCNGYVTYAVVAKDTNGIYYSVSDTVTLPPIDTAFVALGVLKNVTVLNSKTIQIDIVEQDSVSIFGYAIKRKERDSSNWIQRGFIYSVAPGTAFSFYDTADAQNKYYSYQVAVIDSCLNASYSINFEQIQLTGKSGHLQNTLTWNKFKGYNLQRYDITEILPNGGFFRLDTLSPTDTTWMHDSLLCNIPHTYFIIGIENGTGRETYSDTIILTPFDSVPPAQVNIISSTVVNNNSLSVNWQASSPDVGQYVISYKSPKGNWTKVDTLSASTLTYNITPLPVSDSAYSVSIIAYDSCAMNASLAAAAHTSVNLSGNAVNLGVKLNWNLYAGFPIQDQEVERFINGSWTTVLNKDDKTNTATVNNLACNTNQYFRIKTNGLGGESSYSDSILLVPYDTIKPEPAVVKLATVVNSNLVRLEWFASPSPDVKYYNIYRSNGSGTFTNIAQVTYALYYNDSTATANQQSYCYYVVAVDSCNTNNISIASDTECTVKLQFHYQACFPEINISWSPYTYFGDKLLRYEVYRKDSLGIKSLYISDTNTFTYKDSGINLGSTYSYVVVSRSADGTTYTLSDTLDVVPFNYPFPKAPNIYNATTITSSTTLGEIAFTWAKTTDTLVTKYQIYHWNGSPYSSYYLYHETTDMNDTSYVLDSLDTQAGKNYFKMVFRDLCDREGAYSDVHKTMDLAVTPGNLQIALDWSKYEGWPVASYKIWRWDDLNAAAVIAVADSATTTYIDTMVSCTYTYRYYIEAEELFGDFAISNSNINTAVTFDTIPPPRIKIDYATVNSTDPANAEVEVFFNASTDRIRTGYNIYLNDSGSFFKLKNVYPELNNGKLSYAVQGLNTQYLANGFYITVTDSCDNESAPSDTHTVVQLQANAVSGVVNLSWSSYIGFNVNQYILERLDPGQTAWTTIAQFTPTVLSYADSFTICNLTYYYRITAADTNNTLSLSDTAGVLTFEIDPPNATTLINVTVSATSVTNGEINVNWNPSSSRDASGYVLYYRTANDFNWILLSAFTPSLSHKISGLNTVDSSYFFKVAVLDSCGNISTTFSPEHGSMVLVTVPGEQNISLNWNNYTGWQPDSFLILRNGKWLASVPSNTFSYIDSPLSCVRVMYYQVKATNSQFNTYSFSDSSYTRPNDRTPPSPSYIKFATVHQNNHTAKIEFTASKTFDIAFYDIFRKPNGTNGWVKIARTTDTVYYDSTVDAARASYCYRIQSGDSCSNYSLPSNEACLIWLKGKSRNLSNHLSFTPYTFWNNGVDHYEVYRTDDGNMTQLIYTTVTPPTLYMDSLMSRTEVENFCYIVKGIENLGGYEAVTFSNELCLKQEPLVFFPNTFTPNDDDLNETFGPTGLYYKKYDMQILDRWGGVIFKNSEVNPRWDGKFGNNGVIVPMGVYLYRVKIYSYDGKETNYNGLIQIIR